MEGAEMAHISLQIMAAPVGGDAGAEVVSDPGLAETRDVVEFAFDRHQGGPADCREVYAIAVPYEGAARQREFVKHEAHGVEKELGAEIDDPEEQIEERKPGRVDPVVVEHLVQQFAASGQVPQHIREQCGPLDRSGINPPPFARVRPWNSNDRMALEPVWRPQRREPPNAGRVDARIDKAADQDQAARLSRIVGASQDCSGGERWSRRLTQAKKVRVAAKRPQGFDDGGDVVFETEAPGSQGHITGIESIEQEQIVLRQQCREQIAHHRGALTG